jgi:nitrogen fixation/metabolism regulation signal transduction histidine kinase
MTATPRSATREPGPLRSVRFRILAAFLLVMIMSIGALGFLISQYGEVGRTAALVMEGYLPIAKAVDGLRLYEQRVATDLDRLVNDQRRPGTGASSTALIYTDALRDAIDRARAQAAVADTMARGGAEHAALRKIAGHLERIEELFRTYDTNSAGVVNKLEAGNEATADLEDLRQDRARLVEEIDKLSKLISSRVDHLIETTDEQRRRAIAFAALLTATAFLVSFVLLGAVLYALQPIGRLTAQVQRVAAGDWSSQVAVQGRDEIAFLAGEFNAMVDALRVRDRALNDRAEELRLLTRYLGSVLDTLADGLVVVEEGKVTLTNPAAEQTWGVRRGDPPPPPLDREVGTCDIVSPDGALFQVRVTNFGEKGRLIVVADITEATRSKERLARSERLALVGQMLAQITHEVRNPLNALSLNAELLSDELGQLDPDRKTEAWELLDIVSNEIERLTQVTGHYLQLARRPRPRLEATDLAPLLQDVGRLIAAELDRADVSFSIQAQPMKPQLADGNQIRQALLNVVRNAVEAGATTLKLELLREAGDVLLTLKDNGPGMTAEEIDRATDPFFSTKATGTGLGLAITRQILEDHGGQLRVESKPGVGTQLAMVLPLRPAEGP